MWIGTQQLTGLNLGRAQRLVGGNDSQEGIGNASRERVSEGQPVHPVQLADVRQQQAGLVPLPVEATGQPHQVPFRAPFVGRIRQIDDARVGPP